MAWQNFGWGDRPAELDPQAGETLAQWETRIAAYEAAHPGELKQLEDTTLEAFGEHIYGRAVLDAPGSGGAADASPTAKGVAKLSTAPASAANPIAVGDNDSRMTNARTPTAHTHPVAELGSGTPAAGKYLDGGGTWATLPAGGAGGRTLVGTAVPNMGQADGGVGMLPGDTYFVVDNAVTPTKVLGEYVRTT